MATTHHTIRVDDDQWTAAKNKAAAEGTNATAMIVGHLAADAPIEQWLRYPDALTITRQAIADRYPSRTAPETYDYRTPDGIRVQFRWHQEAHSASDYDAHAMHVDVVDLVSADDHGADIVPAHDDDAEQLIARELSPLIYRASLDRAAVRQRREAAETRRQQIRDRLAWYADRVDACESDPQRTGLDLALSGRSSQVRELLADPACPLTEDELRAAARM